MIPVAVGATSLQAYRTALDRRVFDRVQQLAARLAGLRVLHVNATPAGGGVAEILRSLVPLMNGLGVESRWLVLEPASQFFAVTKKLHNALQGKPVVFDRREMELYWSHNELIAQEIYRDGGAADVIVLHDAQVLPSGAFLNGHSRKIWHCHVDITSADPFVRSELLHRLCGRYDRLVLSMPEYVDGLPRERTAVFPPAIDPFTPKNRPLSAEEAAGLLARLGIDVARPLVTQVSRFDPWKDPWGVIDAYRQVKRGVPGLQLGLVGALIAQDDPEGAGTLESVRAYAEGDPDIHIVADPAVADDLTVNAFQTLSDVIVQKSIREGFGLTVSEGMWKGRPVIGGDCGGIRVQIEDGVSGFLVSSPQECAERLSLLLADRSLARRMGAAGRRRVRERFLMPRLLLDYLALFDGVVSASEGMSIGQPETDSVAVAAG